MLHATEVAPVLVARAGALNLMLMFTEHVVLQC